MEHSGLEPPTSALPVCLHPIIRVNSNVLELKNRHEIGILRSSISPLVDLVTFSVWSKFVKRLFPQNSPKMSHISKLNLIEYF